MVSMTCGPILESNASCGGGHCCLPADAGPPRNYGGGGADGGTARTCGSSKCPTGPSYCYSYQPGTGGSGGESCVPVPAGCETNPTCACLCPPNATSGACVRQNAYCNCIDTNGYLSVSCAGA
jgi:hypothetical protein